MIKILYSKNNDAFFIGKEKHKVIESDYIYVDMVKIEDTCDYDKIFDFLNGEKNPLATKEGRDWLMKNKIYHTSMSIGDIIVDGKIMFICMPVGWKQINWGDII
jgi:hypothetical protein